MEWVKRMSSKSGNDAWREDFPLTPELPERLTIDCAELLTPVHPMVLVRMRTFCDWHFAQGRDVTVVPPRDRATRQVLEEMEVLDADPEVERDSTSDVIVPVMKLDGTPAQIEQLAGSVRWLLEYDMPDVATLGAATYMAVSELCGNAVEHGKNRAGAYYLAARRELLPRRRITIALGDLGIGIPEHLRQQMPELKDDDHAIALAIDPRVTGTGHPHRGNGFTETFDAALTSALHAARIEIYSGGGFVRRETVQERVKLDLFPSPTRRRGTWIVYDLVSATA